MDNNNNNTFNNNNGGQIPPQQQWQQPQGAPQQQWQQPQGGPQQWQAPQGAPQQQWQAPPPVPPYANPNYGNYYAGGIPGGRPPKKNNTGLIVVLIIALAAAAVVGVLAYGYFALGWFRSPLAISKTDTVSSSSSVSSSNSDDYIRQMEERASSRAAEEALRQAAEEARISQLSKERSESYASLKEKWDEASRQQQSRVDEIMGRNRDSAGGNTDGNTGGNTGSTPSVQVPVSGTWYGPTNEYSGDRSSVSLYPDGTGEVAIDMGASDVVYFKATYSSIKNGPYEYDDIVCTVTLSGDTSYFGFPSNTFTFVIDPEVENGMYAYFVESGFGTIPGNSTFTK